MPVIGFLSSAFPDRDAGRLRGSSAAMAISTPMRRTLDSGQRVPSRQQNDQLTMDRGERIRHHDQAATRLTRHCGYGTLDKPTTCSGCCCARATSGQAA
jgi:hypothetical protein